MDRYRAAFFLDAMNETRFKVFKAFLVEIPYYIAMPDTLFSRTLMTADSCFKIQIDNQDMEDLLIKYLRPVQVTNVCLHTTFSLVCLVRGVHKQNQDSH